MKPKLLLLTLMLCGISFSQVPTDYVAKYHFTSNSLSNEADPGNGNIASNGAHAFTNDRFSIANHALDCNGFRHSGYNMPNSGAASVNAVALSFWVNMQNAQSNITQIERIVDYVNTNQNGISFGINASGNFYVSSQIGAITKNRAFSNIDLASNNWNHILFQFKKVGQDFKADVYINGIKNTILSNALTISGAPNGTNLFTEAPNEYGQFIINRSSNFNGYLDDIKIYHRALISSEINALSQYPVYVNADATGSNNGTSWADAYTDIRSATANAKSSQQIWVKTGTYKPTTGTDRNAFIGITRNMQLYGGFNGTESYLSDRNLATNGKTILTGDLLGNDAILGNEPSIGDTSRSDNSVTILRITGNNMTNIVIDGFKISDGYANISPSGAAGGSIDSRITGAGLYIDQNISASISIRNCYFFGNLANLSGAGIFYSPAYLSLPSELTLINNKFAFNTASYGSGISVRPRNAVMKFNAYNNLFYLNVSKQTDYPGTYASSINIIEQDNTPIVDVNIVNNTFVNNIEADTDPVSGITDQERSTVFLSSLSASSSLTFDVLAANNIFQSNSFNLNNPSPLTVKSNASTPTILLDHNAEVNNFSTIATGSKMNTVTSVVTFVDPDTIVNDYRLASGSSAIDAGSNSYTTTANIISDLLNNQRIYNTTVDLGAYEFGSTPLSTPEYTKAKDIFRIYPNPVHSTIYITKIDDSSISKVAVYSLTGNKVFETVNTTLNVSNLTNGMYFITVESTDGNIATEKFIKY